MFELQNREMNVITTLGIKYTSKKSTLWKQLCAFFNFLKMGQSRPLFVYFRPFLVTISIQTEKSIDGVLGIRIRGRRMVVADETTELWRPPVPSST